MLCPIFIFLAGLLSAPPHPGIDMEQFRRAETSIGNPESELYDEESFCEVLREALNADILGEADRLRAIYRLEIASKNKCGTIASDFMFRTREGETSSLLATQTHRPLLLLFYDPDCGHCLETIERLKSIGITAMADVIAIDAEEDIDRWNETASSLPEDWTVGFALDPIQDEERYVFVTSPTIYLLGPDKTVILKDAPLDKVIEKINGYEN